MNRPTLSTLPTAIGPAACRRADILAADTLPADILPAAHRRARGALHTIGCAPGRGLATSVAMIRLVQIARLARDDEREDDFDRTRFEHPAEV